MKNTIKKISKWIGILVVIALLAAGFLLFNTFAQFDKLEQGKLQEGFTRDTIPFRYNHTGHILIDVNINNSDRAYPFILDSGASTYLFKNFTKEQPLEGNGFGFSGGIDGNKHLTRIRKIQSFQIGEAIVSKVNAEELNLNWDCMDEVYGLLGSNIMKHLVWDIDFQKQRIILSKHLDKNKRNGAAIEIPIGYGSNSFLDTSIKFRHNKVSKTVRIDLGYAGTLYLKEDVLIEDGLNFRKKRKVGMGSKGLGYARNNSSLDEQYYLVDSLIFSDAAYSVNSFPIKAIPKGLGNLLGLGFFKKYRTTISWRDWVVLLEPYDTTQNFVKKTYGFSTGYNEAQNKVEIESITEHTPASRAGVPLFSEVISINQQTFTNSQSYCEYLTAEQLRDTLNLEIRQNDSIQSFQLTKEFLFD